MAATGKTPILLYGSTTATNVPVAGNLTNSSDGCEIAINVADKNLFFKDSTNAVNTVPIRQSSSSSDGWLSSANWTTFNSKQAAYTNLTSIGSLANATGWLYNNGSGTFSYSTPTASDVGAVPTTRTISTTTPLAGGGDLSANRTFSITQATTSTDGYLSSTDWNTFNSKAPAFTYTSGYIPFGQGTTTPTQDSSLYWDNTNKKLSIGTTTPTSSALAGKVPDINVQKAGTSFSSLAARSFATTNAAGGMLVLGRSNSATLGTLTATTDGQNFGYIGFEGVNTSSAVSYPAYITAQEDGANGATYTPGRIMFYTGTAAAAPVEQLRIASTGDVTVKTGNLVIGTSGKGIDFSATAGTGTSELLADYEEGDWTPTLVFASGSAVLNSTITKAKYTKVGRLVTVTGIVYVTSVSTPSGSTYIGGLPYTPASGYGTRSGVSILAETMQATATTAISGVVLESVANIYIFKFAAGATSNVGADVKADTAFTFCASYMT